jgi:type VI secretion system protein ImpG
MFNRYFQQELDHLRDLGAEFARMHPAVAPMLSGLSTDPDVERLLEGVAFLTGLLRQKLDDDFPEIIHELFQLIWPHYLRPLPAASIVAFAPKASLKQTVRVEKGVQLASVPVDGTACLFRTCYDVDVHPLVLEDAVLEDKPGHPPAIRLLFALQDLSLDDWQPAGLRLYLSGEAQRAAEIYLVLRRYLQKIIWTPTGGGESCVLSRDHLRPVGFGAEDELIPYPRRSFPGYRMIQEYFILPEKFLFLDLTGLEQWKRRGTGSRFEVRLELNPPASFVVPRVRQNNFTLAATPVINLFDHDADPIRLDHRSSEYRVRPAGAKERHYQVYTVESVTGFIQGTARDRVYRPFEMFSPNPEAQPVYHALIRQSPVRSGHDFYLSVAYPPGSGTPVSETLSIKLQCTNGYLPEGLQVGDICIPTSSTPEFLTFTNIRPPTASIAPPMGRNLLWQLISHLCLNYQSLAAADNLKAMLELYNFEENRDRPAFLANQKRIAGIQAVASRAADRLVGRVIMRGREIQLNVRQDHFAGAGDLFLFGTVLDHFLGSYATINTYTRLLIKDMLKGEVYQWPPRLGDHPLI